jgi:hypothetical protein
LSWLSRWTRVPWNLTAAFLAVAAVSVVALISLGVRLVAQDRALEAERLREKRESTADRVVAAWTRRSPPTSGASPASPWRPLTQVRPASSSS